MEPTKLSFYEELEQDIRNAYEKATDEDEAKHLAAKFLLAQLDAGRELANLDLDARMKKTGLKACKGTAYLQFASVADGGKKPTEATLTSFIDTDKSVIAEQDRLDKAEVERNLVQNYLNVFSEAHIFFRKLSDKRFE